VPLKQTTHFFLYFTAFRPLNPIRALPAFTKALSNHQTITVEPKSGEDIYGSNSKLYQDSNSKLSKW